MEARVEGLVEQALGTRAKLVRAFREPLHGGPKLEASSTSPSSASILVAAKVRTAVSASFSIALRTTCPLSRAVPGVRVWTTLVTVED